MTRGSRSAPVTGVLLGLLVVLLPAVVPAPASAATTVGSTPSPNTNCNSVFTFVPSPATGYTVAAPGIVTAWRFQAAGNAPQLKLKVFRPVGPTTYTIIGATGPVAPVLNVLNTFAARIAVQAGDVLGFTTLSTGACFATPGGGFVAASGDVAVGGTQTFASSLAGTLDVAAIVEPDADGDGYGDETQDACPSQSGTQGACAGPPDTSAPESRLTAGPTRTARSKATFRFTSDDPGARYECRLTGRKVRTIQLRTFRPCTSPKTYQRLRPGRYLVAVRAINAVGNVETTPATSRLRVVTRKS